MGLGIVYFGLLLLITLGVYRTLNGNAANLMTTFILCAGGGMAGGMLSWLISFNTKKGLRILEENDIITKVNQVKEEMLSWNM